jgi:GT2 family glycosyltransferase
LKSVSFLFFTISFNRKAKTLLSIKTICDGMPLSCDFKIIVIDNNSTDGTYESINLLKNKNVSIFKTNKNYYWAEGMVYGFNIIKSMYSFEYLVPFNDDIKLKKNWWSIVKSDLKSIKVLTEDFALSGCFYDDNGDLSYSGFKSINKLYFLKLKIQAPQHEIIQVDTMNFNFVIISNKTINKIGFLDSVYTHSLADLDYGFKLFRKSIPIFISSDYIGRCNRNSIKNTSSDKSLSFFQRINRLHSKKEQPFFIRLYFFLKNDKFLGLITFFVVYFSLLFNKTEK